MRAGPLRHRVTIQVRAIEQDAAGEPLNVWATFAERWAQVEPLLGRELYASKERHGRVQTRFRMRHFEGLKPSMRIVWQTRVFDITDVQTVRGIRHEIVCMADEIVGATP